MNVFIDANVLLGLYKMSGTDLETLELFVRLVEKEEVTLWVSELLVDEFYRNREKIIAESIKQFNGSKVELHLPSMFRMHDESKRLELLKAEFESERQKLEKIVRQKAEGDFLEADMTIARLLKIAGVKSVKSETEAAGIRRSDLRYPPGKRDSSGDAIHWEWLLTELPFATDLHLVSGDSDYGSKLTPGRLARFLEDEWGTRNKAECRLYVALSQFLVENFPDIKLVDEIDKVVAIQRFEQSGSFLATHRAIADLLNVPEFTRPDLARLLQVFNVNDQVRWILGDSDVREFANRILSEAHVKGVETEEFQSLRNAVAELDATEGDY